MNTIDSVYQKYISIFYEIDAADTRIDLSTVRYAMRAALHDLAARQPGADIIEEHSYLEDLVYRCERVLKAHDSELYADLVAGNIALSTAFDDLIASYKAALAAVAADTQRSNARLEQLNRINEWISTNAGDAYDPSAMETPPQSALERIAVALERIAAALPSADSQIAESVRIWGASEVAP